MKRFIEYPAGTFTQVTWSGATSVTVLSSALVSDPVSITIPKGSKFWVRTVWLAGTMPVSQLSASATVLGLDDGNAAGDLGNSGTVTPGSTFALGPAAIMGTVGVSNARGFLLVGDSICFGSSAIGGGVGDLTSTGSGGSSGYMGRALDAVAPYVKLAYPGIKATDLVTLLGGGGGVNRVTTFMHALGYTNYWMQFGVNDLGSGGRTAAQLLADSATIAGYANAGAVIDQSTLTAQSSSTDAWATTGNQTAPTQIAIKNTFDDAVRAIPAYLTGKVNDAADASMTGRNTEIWPAPPAPTADGTHPNSTGAASIAALLSP
jgi:lysophospholipase L1-like esterase